PDAKRLLEILSANGNAELALTGRFRFNICSEDPGVLGPIAREPFHTGAAAEMHFAGGILNCLEITQPGQVDCESRFLVGYQRRILELKLTFVRPYCRLERLSFIRLRRGCLCLRVPRTAGEKDRHRKTGKKPRHGRTSSPTTRSSSIRASFTAARRSSRRRLA